MVGIIFDYYFYQQSYSNLKSKNVVKFCVHISPIFSCPVTYIYKVAKGDKTNHGWDNILSFKLLCTFEVTVFNTVNGYLHFLALPDIRALSH